MVKYSLRLLAPPPETHISKYLMIALFSVVAVAVAVAVCHIKRTEPFLCLGLSAQCHEYIRVCSR